MFTLPQMPSIKVPAIKIPAIDLPNFDLPKFDLSNVDTTKLTAAVRDAGYIVVGLGATVVEHVQARSEEWATVVNTAVNDGIEQVRGLLRNAA